MAGTFHLSIITPERADLETEADAVVFPAWDGEVGVLPQSSPLPLRNGHRSPPRRIPGGQTGPRRRRRLRPDGGVQAPRFKRETPRELLFSCPGPIPDSTCQRLSKGAGFRRSETAGFARPASSARRRRAPAGRIGEEPAAGSPCSPARPKLPATGGLRRTTLLAGHSSSSRSDESRSIPRTHGA